MSANGKHRFAMYWAASCGGCDISVINLHEAILDLAERFDIVFWPAVMDAKYADVEAMPDGSIDLTLFSGGIRNTENAELARLLRRKSPSMQSTRRWLISARTALRFKVVTLLPSRGMALVMTIFNRR